MRLVLHMLLTSRCTHFFVIVLPFFVPTDGAFDYADKWVMAAFGGARTSFSNGNADFGLYDFEGKRGE